MIRVTFSPLRKSPTNQIHLSRLEKVVGDFEVFSMADFICILHSKLIINYFKSNVSLVHLKTNVMGSVCGLFDELSFVIRRAPPGGSLCH